MNLKCWFCGAPMIWGADFDYADYGLEGEGIVATFLCSKCQVTAEFYCPIKENNDK